MELAACSLYDILHREGKSASLPVDPKSLSVLHTFTWKVHLLVDIISALSFLHFHGVLHRDIKTANIMLVIDQSRIATTGLPFMAKLSDFGLASAVGLSSSGQSMATWVEGSGGAVGSTAYMSPELLDFEHYPLYSPAVDVYACGIVANELLTEQIPWAGLRDIHILNLVVNKHQRPARFTSADALEKHTIEMVIGDQTSGALHQDANARPSASTLSKHLYEYLRFIAENEFAIKPMATPPTKVAARPALIKQIAQTLFPTMIEEEEEFVEDSEPSTPFSPYPDAPELIGSVLSISTTSEVSNKSSVSSAKPVKPLKPKSLKSTVIIDFNFNRVVLVKDC